MAPLNPRSVLNSATGLQLPVIGLGTYLATGPEVEAALNSALEAGYRLIDTAYLYNNEAIVGKVLREWFASGKLKRDDIFITTKLPIYGNHPEKVRPFLLSSLKALQLDYVDLYLIHNPVGVVEDEAMRKRDYSNIKLDVTTDIIALWKEMEKQVDAGLAKNIGVCNFNPKQLERILAVSRVPPANLQIELYLYQQAAEERKLCAKNGITITSYSTLGARGRPNAVVNCTDNPLEDPVVKRVATAHSKSPAQILLRHTLQLGIAIIPKSCTPERIRQNIQIFDFELSEAEMKELSSLDRGEAGRRSRNIFMLGHPEYAYAVSASRET